MFDCYRHHRGRALKPRDDSHLTNRYNRVYRCKQHAISCLNGELSSEEDIHLRAFGPGLTNHLLRGEDPWFDGFQDFHHVSCLKPLEHRDLSDDPYKFV